MTSQLEVESMSAEPNFTALHKHIEDPRMASEVETELDSDEQIDVAREAFDAGLGEDSCLQELESFDLDDFGDLVPAEFDY